LRCAVASSIEQLRAYRAIALCGVQTVYKHTGHGAMTIDAYLVWLPCISRITAITPYTLSMCTARSRPA
jgi:hypothetical protein